MKRALLFSCRMIRQRAPSINTSQSAVGVCRGRSGGLCGLDGCLFACVVSTLEESHPLLSLKLSLCCNDLSICVLSICVIFLLLVVLCCSLSLCIWWSVFVCGCGWGCLSVCLTLFLISVTPFSLLSDSRYLCVSLCVFVYLYVLLVFLLYFVSCSFLAVRYVSVYGCLLSLSG